MPSQRQHAEWADIALQQVQRLLTETSVPEASTAQLVEFAVAARAAELNLLDAGASPSMVEFLAALMRSVRTEAARR